MHSNQNLLGRFAPSPTGPLHMGSLIAAVASYCDIKQKGGRWHVRIDDLDPPRTAVNACTSILQTLEAHGLISDLPIIYQSQRITAYRDALNQLMSYAFFCTCSRKQLEHFPVYPGTCRNNKERLENTSIRLSVGEQKLACHDLVLGTQEHELGKVFGDFVIQRKDGLTSYNLATAVDDAQEITHVIRGQDLYPTTPIQLLIMQRLKLSPPTYGHIPVLTYGDGRKLSKQTLAPAIDNGLATSNLIKVFTYLGMPVPNTDEWTVEQLLQWGIGNWDLSKVPSKLRPYSA
ncbi:MAG: tRNA glutamyl-Q(34) synthetase GluQRS [Pseudomonadales bacterium]|nr:tRNA glutamyl-Q(34) synthetase GluQRS [Pseudomonadales bacterium]